MNDFKQLLWKNVPEKITLWWILHLYNNGMKRGINYTAVKNMCKCLIKKIGTQVPVTPVANYKYNHAFC